MKRPHPSPPVPPTINDAWIVFQMNETPIQTGEGPCDCVALMDAHSGYIFGITMVADLSAGLSRDDVRQLLSQGKAKSEQRPNRLWIPNEMNAESLIAEAERQDISVERFADAALSQFTTEARDSFRAHLAPRRH